MQPYKNRDAKFFWSPAVAQRNMFDISDLWDPKFKIGKQQRVATYGSCFAQHIGRALRDNGFNWYIAEQAPKGMSEESAKKFNFGVFSSRTGNIYTVSLLKQWLQWSLEGKAVPEEVWENNGRFFDPFRPNIEPEGFASASEVRASRSLAISAFASSVKDADIFVFTLGLTESWFNSQGEYEYPMCPGTVAGEFDGEVHKFLNQDYQFIRETLMDCIRLMRKHNPSLKILLTVSPVPLTATMSSNHILVATMESKSILRAVAGKVTGQLRFVDYFPSYEIINSTPYRGGFFEPNQRSVNHAGVAHVMTNFFSCLKKKFPGLMANRGAQSEMARTKPKIARGLTKAGAIVKPTSKDNSDDVVCEEELLNAFSKPA